MKRHAAQQRRRRALGLAVPLALLLSGAALAAVGATASPSATPGQTPTVDPAGAGKRVFQIDIDGVINPATADFVRESLRTAEEQGAAALLIRLDTPGGLLDSTQQIVQDLLGANLPTIVYVAPSGGGAISAGVFVTLAGAVAAMAPGTNIGAAHPVSAQGEDIGGDMREKIENSAVSLIKSIAGERGRNVEWAEKAVRESVSITETEALELGVIDLIANDRDSLLQQASGRTIRVHHAEVTLALTGAAVTQLEMSLMQEILNVLAHPNVAYLLMMAGFLGLYIELTNPGLLFPGVAGGIALLLALVAFQVLPINYGGIGLIVLGIALLVAEMFLPSFGILGIGGIASFVLGSLFLFDTAKSGAAVDPTLIYSVAATFALVGLIIGTMVLRTQLQPAALGSEGMLGMRGEVRQAVGPDNKNGKVFVHGEIWNARAAEPIEAQATVEIVRVDGLELVVRRAAREEV